MIRFDNHAYKGLDDGLKQLFTLITAMGDGVESLISMLPATLERANADSFAAAKAVDKTINQAETEVDTTVAGMINKFTLVGEDLRFALAAIKLAGTLERMADKIKNCIKRLSRVSQSPDPAVRAQLHAAIDAMHQMVPLALVHVVDYNAQATTQLLKHGAAVQHAYRTILLALHAHAHPADDETHLMLVAKNLEQAADMAVEIMKICHVVHTGTKYEKKGQAE